MMVLIIIIAIGAIMAFILVLAAAMLSSNISSEEYEYQADDFTDKHGDLASPNGQVPSLIPTPSASHVVRQGDSLGTIASWYELSLEELLWLNSMEEDSLVQAGDEVRIRLLPGEHPPANGYSPEQSQSIQAGDTA